MRLSEALATQAPEREQARGGSGMRLSAALQSPNTRPAAASPMRLSTALTAPPSTDFQGASLTIPPESTAPHIDIAAPDSMPEGERPELYIRDPVMIPPVPPAVNGQPDPVSRETPADALSKLLYGASPFDRSPIERERTPPTLLDDLRNGQGSAVTPQEFGSVLRWFENGAFEDPQQIRNLLSLSLTREGLQAVDEAILVRRLLDEANPVQEKKGAGAALLDGFVRGVTLNAEHPQWDPVTTDRKTLRLSAAMKRAGDIQREKLTREHPVASFGGEALSTVLPYSVGTKVLRGVRAARGLTPVVETPSGFVAEGAKVGGALEFLRRPEGAEDMGAGDELKARLTQSGIGIAAGAILDFGAAKIGQFVGRYTQALRDKRLARALSDEAKANGFESPDEYLASLVDFVQTADGVIVRPKAEVNETLPGEAPPFQAEHDLRLQEHKRKAVKYRLTAEQEAAFAPEPVTDALTGFQGRRDREATVDRAVEYANKYRRPGHYVAFDLVNLNGLNAKLGEPGADRVYQAFARIIEDEFSDLPGQVQLFRHGGDEMSAVVLDIEKDVLDQAVARVQSRVSDFVAQNDMGAIPHTKAGKGAGTGLTVTSSQIRPGDTGSALLDRVNRALEKAKGEPAGEAAYHGPVEPFVPKTEVQRLNRAPARDSDFPTEHELRVQEHNSKAGEHGLTEEQAAAFAPEPNKDHLTGFQGRRDRDATLKRAIRYAADQGQDGHYVAFDLVNLGGLNARFGESGADVIFRNLATIVDDELGALPGHVQLFRHGGDEMSAVALGVDKEALERALQRIEQRADEYVRSNGLESVPHTKQGKGPGTGINYGVSKFDGKTYHDILDDAHNRLEFAKVAKPESGDVDLSVSEKTRAAGPDGQAGGVSPVVGKTHPGDGGEIRTTDGKGQESTTHQTAVARKARLAEYRRLAASATDPDVRADLERQAALLQAEIDGEAVKLTPKERARRARYVDPEKDDLITAIRKLGGIDVTLESDWTGRLSHLPRKGFGLPGIEQVSGGRSLDDLAEALYERGYLSARDKSELEEKLSRAETGDDVYSLQRTFEDYDEPYPQSTDRDWVYHDVNDLDEVDADFVIDTDSGTVVPSRPLTLDDVLRLREEEKNAEAWFRKEGESFDEEGAGGHGLRERLEDSPQEIRGDQSEPGTPSVRDKIDGGYKIRSPKGDYSPWRPESESASQLFLPPAADEAAHQTALATFGRRVKHVETGTFPTGLSRVKNAADVAHVVAPLRKDAQESFLAVAADDAGNILRIARLHRGAQGEASVDPTLVAGALTNTPGATRAWVAHNHPSGNVAQSEADRVLIEKIGELLRGAGVELQGGVVIAPGGRVHSTIGRDGTGAFVSTPAKPRTKNVPVSERRLVGRESKLPAIEDPKDAHAALKKLGSGREGVLFLNDDNRPVGFLPLSAQEMRELRTGRGGGADRLLSALDETNASGFIIRTDSLPAVGNVNAFAEQTGRTLIDALDSKGDSFALRGDLPTQSTVYANPFPIAFAHFARDIGLHPGRNAAASAAGAVYGATSSDAEPGSARWWLDLAAGATGGMLLSQFIRGTGLLGKGSIVDNARVRMGRYIESLPLIGRGPAEVRDLKRKQRLMRQILDRQTDKVGEYLAKHFSPAERAMMADLIETRGIVKDLNLIHSQAQALDDYLTQVAARMKGLGMLSEDLEAGGYLHRYYAKHLGLDKLFREAKRQTLSGSYTIARGTEDVFSREYLSPGARTVLDEFDQLRRELAKLEKKSGDLLRDDTLKRIAELKGRLRQLGKVELAEFVGEQNGKLRSFLFAADEVGRVSDRLVHKDKSGPALALLEIPGVKDLSPTERRWTVRGTRRDGQVLLRRDWTKAERESWGEIQDAGYRYVRGMAEVSHDMSLAVLFDTVAKRKDWVSTEPRLTNKGKPWVFVPETKVHKNSPLRKYGKLSGKYVSPEVWNAIRNYGRAPFAQGPAGNIYRGLLNRWKLYKTVYNPVTHFNNTWSNVEMLHMAGYHMGDLAQGFRHMAKGEDSALWREARDNGLFGTDWSASLLKSSEGGGNRRLEELAERLRTQPEIPDAALATSVMMDVKQWWIESTHAVANAPTRVKSGAALAKAMAAPVVKGLRIVKKPVDAAAKSAQRLYQFEDEVFKMAVFSAAKRQGKSSAEAVREAQAFFFDYNDLPEAVKIVRDFPIGSPFISYTYLAIPAIARNIAQNPEKVLALVAGYEAWNYGVLMADGVEPGEYWATVAAEDTVSPPWERGRAIWGALNNVHLPFPEGYRLAVGRAHAVGNPFMSEAGGREKLPTVPYLANFWGSSMFGSNPLHAILDTLVNEDWKGKEIYKPGAPPEAKAKAVASYLYQAWAPSNPLTPGSYHQQKILEGMANDKAKASNSGERAVIAPMVEAANGVAEALGLEGFTGLDRAGNEILTRDALLASFGIKLRPIRWAQSREFELQAMEEAIQEREEYLSAEARKKGEKRITEKRFNTARKATKQSIKELIEKQREADKARGRLEEQGRWR